MIADVLLLGVITVLSAVRLELGEAHRRHRRVSQRGFWRSVYHFVRGYQHRLGVRHFFLRQQFRLSESPPETRRNVWRVINAGPSGVGRGG